MRRIAVPTSNRTIRLRHEIATRINELRVRSPTTTPPEITHRQLLLRVNSGLKARLRLVDNYIRPIHVHTSYDPRVIRRVLADADTLADLGIDVDLCYHGPVPTRVSLAIVR